MGPCNLYWVQDCHILPEFQNQYFFHKTIFFIRQILFIRIYDFLLRTIFLIFFMRNANCRHLATLFGHSGSSVCALERGRSYARTRSLKEKWKYVHFAVKILRFIAKIMFLVSTFNQYRGTFKPLASVTIHITAS